MLQPGGDAPILATKLFVPPPRDQMVSRERLRNRLASTRGGQVTLVAAAAGWGKSTLLAGWALDAQGRVAWLSLDASDDDPRRFLNYVIAALRTANAIGEDDRFETLSAERHAVRSSATELLNTLALRGGPVSLVLDDYHAIESRAVHDVVQFTLDHLPPNLHLVLSTRADPPLALSRLRARGQLLELRGDDLRFTAEEAKDFLNGAMGLALEAGDVAELERRTEGWVVGLQMAAISLSGRDGAHAFVQRFSGSNRYVLDYLTDEVLDRQPKEVRDFLLRTSILTRLSPGLCDAVLERTDSLAILEQLDAANLFLIPLDDVRYWYRYHHLFATLLQHHLARACSAEEIGELHRRACGWYESERMIEPALDHALAGNDVPRAVTIIRQQSLIRMFNGDMAAVARWFERLPQAYIESDVELLLRRSMTLLGDWQLPRAYETILRASQLVDQGVSTERRGAVLGMRGALERALGKQEEGLAHLREAVPLVEQDSFWFCLVHYFLGITAVFEANAGAVDASFAPVRARHSRMEEIVTSSLAQAFTAMAQWWRGQPGRAAAMASDLFSWIDITEKAVEGRPLDCLPCAVMATVHCSWNDLDTARGFAERALEHGRRSIMIGFFEASRVLTLVAMAARDWDAAARALNDMQRAVKNVGTNPSWLLEAACLGQTMRYRRWQWTGDREDFAAVDHWLRSTDVVQRFKVWLVRRTGGLHCDAPLFLAARVLMERGQYDEAVALLDEVLPHAEETERVVSQIEAHVIRAIVDARRGRLDDAQASMVRALVLASEPRYLRPFLDEGPSVAPLVERAAATIPNRDFATRLLGSLDGAVPRPVRVVEGLSERELEVLRLVASGASNQEAGRKLFIASSTVKKHLENIYAKLAVGGRVEAISRARELGLLS
ncbi:MAG TPA: LuxR C-terminal-related transcriptional regulator [Thermoanaerobaculia bacterium]|nr:LuxR C-terminal-related transcriptional regulator [Thermoanaerobaculia bacterium]